MDSRFKAVVGMIAALLMTAGLAAAEEKNMTPLDIPMIGDVEALQAGADAPSFEAKEIYGKKYVFDAAAKGGKLVVFWSIFCEPCREEMPLIQSMSAKYKTKGLEVVAVALDGNLEENIRQFVKQGKYTFTVVTDQESEDGSLVLAEKFMVPGTPTIYIINGKGKVTFTRVGRISEAELEKAVTQALAN